MNKKSYNSLINKSYKFQGKTIFIQKIEESTKFFKIYLDGDLKIFDKDKFEQDFVSKLEIKIDDLTVQDEEVINKPKRILVIEKVEKIKKKMENTTPKTQQEATTKQLTTPINSTENTAVATEQSITPVNFIDKGDLLKLTLDGSEDIKDALKIALNKLKAAKSNDEITQAIDFAKGTTMVTNEMNKLINTKTNAISAIANL